MNNKLEKHIIDTFGFTESEYNSIRPFFQNREIKKGDFFLKEGQVVREMGFVESGILREYLYVDGQEVTKWFSTEGYFAVDLSGFLFDRPSRVYYEALTDVELLVLTRENYNKLGEKISRWNQLEKMFLAKCFSVLEDRIITHLALTAEERYKSLFQFWPELFNQVPLNQIASMLGMSPETLSRIRKN